MTRHRFTQAIHLAIIVGSAAASMMTNSVTAQADDAQVAVAAPVGTIVMSVHGVGAQIFECKADRNQNLVWSFREPIATLTAGGTTVGRHFAGPSWETSDGSLVVGKVVAQAPGSTASDVPWLRLDVSQHRGAGALSDVTVVQRISTVGGVRSGPCSSKGALVAEPYSADYVFSRP